MPEPAVYLMSNRRDGVLYVGVTSDLVKRVWQHREHVVPGFTSRYRLDRLVWFELHPTMESAIQREQQLKAGNRARKCALIEAMNPGWDDLWPRIIGAVPPEEIASLRSR